MSTVMSAIAVLCTLNCAVMPVVAEPLMQTGQGSPMAQLPGGVAAQEIELEGEMNYGEIQIQDRTGQQQQFSLEANPTEGATDPEAIPTPPAVLEVISDRQEYNEQTQVVTAMGNVIVRFQEAVLSADQLQINLNSKLAIARGDVALRRGQQILRGEQFTYFFVQNRGQIQQAEGEISQTTLNQDLGVRPTRFGVSSNPAVLLNERLLLNQPATEVIGEEGISFVLGSGRDIGTRDIDTQTNVINRVRFQAESVEFVGDRWEAKNISITNDPFSPPELQLVADTATYQKVDEFNDELVTTKTRLVIDNNVSLPVFPRTFRFGESEGIFSQVSFGFDDEEKGGLFLQRRFSLYRSAQGRWTVTPQYLLQKAWFPDTILAETNDDDAGEILAPGVFAVTSEFDYRFNPRVSFAARGSLENLKLDNFEDKLELNFRLEQQLGNLDNPFRLSQEFNYRDRLFNGSLGFQRVQRSFGIVLRSPRYILGNSGFEVDFQASVQNIEADTDRPDLLEPGVSEDQVNLTRYQGSFNLDHRFPLWSGEPLPPTRFEGLRYSPRPIVPYVSLVTGLQGVAGVYSNGDRQNSLRGKIGIEGQFGRFAGNSFDYTGFNLSYTNSVLSDELSPFLFDRAVDQRTLEFGLTQQLYGPFRVGFQTAINLDSEEAISTDYFLEYSRRTHGVLLRYNPVLEIGSVNITINSFNWNGSTDPFTNEEIRPVSDGVTP
ncbi:DUF3769 domain-containing protein [Picosynechococcus sp. PCC 8807]|uniref:DUF3769 domain-containing protein n=2 Tax=Picosynechococcus sp. PCC 8807 TaxID=195248 RepID=UPI001E3CBA77|nr:DUF3769 domain-containing protein [Picosynechococcus sp. PCC 8807]